LLTVSGYPLDLHDRALDILDDDGSIDIDERQGLGIGTLVAFGFDRGVRIVVVRSDQQYGPHVHNRSQQRRSHSGCRGRAAGRQAKSAVNNGRVRVPSYVTETPVSESVSLRDENVEVTRRTVDRPLTGD
jgi:hypothetical protein